MGSPLREALIGTGAAFCSPAPRKRREGQSSRGRKEGNNVGRLCVAADNEDGLNENLYRPGWGFIEVQHPLITSLRPQSGQMEPAFGNLSGFRKDEPGDCFQFTLGLLS